VALDQVHGAQVHQIRGPGDLAQVSMRPGDALVTDQSGVVLSVTSADCAPVALIGGAGVIGAVHAGWRGLLAGVVATAADAMRSLGAGTIVAWLGPCIHPECYEFGVHDLDALVRRFGPAVRGVTARGAPALDLPAVVAAALGRAEIALEGSADLCTGCADAGLFSHRARRDARRHALAVWMEGE
jgi:polyphenol oxidase